MDSRARREVDNSAAPTANFLQARTTALSTTLIKRFENILATSLDETDINGNPVTPALTDTAMQQMQLEVDATALVKAAEEIMTLTRSMKEIWLFGALNTIKSDDEKAQMEEKERKLAEDARAVREGMDAFLKIYPHIRKKEEAMAVESNEHG